MTERLEVTTPWTAQRTPRVVDDHLMGSAGDWTCSDVTGQDAAQILPATNLYNVVVECDAATADAIEADSTYYVHWRETVEDAT